MMLTLSLYAALGAAAGLLAGLFGVGGGIIIVPMLVIAFGYQHIPQELIMHLALGTSLASIMLTSVSSARSHHLRGGVNWAIVKKITPAILIGTYLGSLCAGYLSKHFLQMFFAVFLLLVSVQMFSGKKPKPTRHLPGLPGMSAVGGVIGVVSSLVGIGGGTLSVPFMLMHNVPAHTAIGTSAAIGFPIALAGTVGYLTSGWNNPLLPEYAVGYVYLPALLGMVLVSVLTAPIGARIAHGLPVDKLKRGFAVFLLIIGIRMFVGAL